MVCLWICFQLLLKEGREGKRTPQFALHMKSIKVSATDIRKIVSS